MHRHYSLQLSLNTEENQHFVKSGYSVASLMIKKQKLTRTFYFRLDKQVCQDKDVIQRNASCLTHFGWGSLQHVAFSRWACLCRLSNNDTCWPGLCLSFCSKLQMDRHMLELRQARHLHVTQITYFCSIMQTSQSKDLKWNSNWSALPYFMHWLKLYGWESEFIIPFIH